MMKLFSAIYGSAVNARNRRFDEGRREAKRLESPVVSIGNISVGGSGKTPFTILLGSLLNQRSIPFDVLSRGYRRESTGIKIVDPNGSATEFGDEPLLIAKRLAVPVIVGSNRYQAGVRAERRFMSGMHLLDDGFQHRQLARQFDIVLVNEEDLDDRLLPSGHLREPVSALERSDVLVIPSNQSSERFSAFGKPIWRVIRTMRVPPKAPTRPLAFCGLARPQRFFKDLETRGIKPCAMVAFPDHHRYSLGEIDKLRKIADRNRADGFMTTQKDLMNLGDMVKRLDPIAIPILEMELLNAKACLDHLLSTIEARRSRPS
ncbi:MAG: tetraacyldisaccharide 4'-kinase [Terriglobia bacterium]|jgi:tetraacyldisaccharide 4'-kinase|nr:tetraacyldisaccharide 4'-kinase [Terriglobia bacterium]